MDSSSAREIRQTAFEARAGLDAAFSSIALLKRRKLQVGADVAALTCAFALAYLLRFDFRIPDEQFAEFLVQLPVVVPIQLAALVATGIYSFIWRYIGMAEIKSFLGAGALAFAPLVLLRLGLPDTAQEYRVPLSIIVMDTVFGFGTLLAMRVTRRALYERRERRLAIPRFSAGAKKRVLLVGAGRGGVLAAREILGRGDADLDVVGFIDDDREKHGAVIHGIPVLGTSDDLPRLARELAIDHVVITIARASRQNIRRILTLCEQIALKVRIIPCLYDILEGRLKVSRIRDVQVEDLLGREPVHLDEHDMDRFLTGKRVLISGAGGSIGSELARQVARFKPARLMLVDRAEFALFEIERELRETRPELRIEALVGDVGNEAHMRKLFASREPQIVVHAAAHKHVPMMEFCPAEAVRNNTLATRTLGCVAAESGAEAFVLISTDKAVRPTSVMGATKRVAELIVQDLDRRYDTRYVAVRFGNVIGSAGSVIPLFREQIRKGGPVRVTHPGMVRYFMTIPEAAQLVLQAGAIGRGGEIFVLDMGEPVNILDLAKETITLTGLRPFDDVEIVFTGVRPGEKLFEEIEISDELLERTRYPKIFIGRIAAYPAEKMAEAVERLGQLAQSGDDVALRAYLNTFLPEARLSRANPVDNRPVPYDERAHGAFTAIGGTAH